MEFSGKLSDDALKQLAGLMGQGKSVRKARDKVKPGDLPLLPARSRPIGGITWRMAHSRPLMRALSFAVTLLLVTSSVKAAFVQALGDAAWDSGDTRAEGYVNNNNPPDSQLVRGRLRADTPGLLEDTLIIPRLSFTMPTIPPPRGPGAVHFVTAASGDSAMLDQRGFGIPLFDTNLSFNYAWMRSSGGSPTVAAPALKLGIDTGETNPAGDQANDRGENRFDKILVYEPYHQSTTQDDTWTSEVIDPTTGVFWLVNLTGPSALIPTDESDLRTLDQWATAFGTADLGTATINSIQIGVGSGNPGQDSYVDYLDFTSSSDEMSWNFGIPEPASASLLAIGSALLACLRGRRSRR